MKYPTIKENHLFKRAYSRGKKFAGKYCVVYTLREPDANRQNGVGRLGITVTKRQGGAVVRNRVKRIIREAYRMLDRSHGLVNGRLTVIVARDAAAGASSRDIYDELVRAARYLSLLKPQIENQVENQRDIKAEAQNEKQNGAQNGALNGAETGAETGAEEAAL